LRRPYTEILDTTYKLDTLFATETLYYALLI